MTLQMRVRLDVSRQLCTVDFEYCNQRKSGDIIAWQCMSQAMHVCQFYNYNMQNSIFRNIRMNVFQVLRNVSSYKLANWFQQPIIKLLKLPI